MRESALVAVRELEEIVEGLCAGCAAGIAPEVQLAIVADQLRADAAEIVRLTEKLKRIEAMASAPHWTSDRRWRIADEARVTPSTARATTEEGR